MGDSTETGTDTRIETQTETAAKSVGPLGQHLAAIRADRRLSLRQVEERTKKLVSNAYLSQIETGKILHPSPNILHALSEAYQASYEKLMELAGYINAKHEDGAVHGRAATFAELNLSEAEERMLLEYLKFRRSEKASDVEGG